MQTHCDGFGFVETGHVPVFSVLNRLFEHV